MPSSLLRRCALPALFCGALLFAAGCGGEQRSAPSSAPSAKPQPAAGNPAPVVKRPANLGPAVPAPEGLASAPERTLEQIAFEYSWDLQFPAPVHNSWNDPDVPGLLIFQLVTGEIHAVEADSGMTRFVTEPLPALVQYPIDMLRRAIVRKERQQAAGFEERLFVISQSTLFCFDGAHGQVVWRYELPFEPSSGPKVEGIISAPRVVIGDWAGRVQVVSFDPESQLPFVQWQSRLAGVAQAQPSSSEDLLYVPDTSGSLSCFTLDRERKWSFQAHGPIMGSVAIRGRSLYLGANDNVLHVINRLSGVRLGQLYLDAPIRSRPLLYDNEPQTVYVLTDDQQRGGLWAVRSQADSVAYVDVADPRFPLEVERLEQQWFVPHIAHVVGSSPRQIYGTTMDSPAIYAIDKKTGSVDWRWDITLTRGEPVTHLVSYNDPSDSVRSVISVSGNGHCVAYRIFGQFAR